MLLTGVVDQFPRGTIRDADCAEIPCGINVPAGFSRSGIGSDIGENDYRKFQPFRGMDRHDPHALRSLFNDGRFCTVLCLRLLVTLLDKSAEKVTASEFVGASQIANVVHVCENLISRGTQRKGRMRARNFQDRVYSFDNCTTITPAMQIRDRGEHIADRIKVGMETFRQSPEWSKRTHFVAEAQ